MTAVGRAAVRALRPVPARIAGCLGLVAAALLGQAVAGEDTPMQWLKRMGQAMQTLNYEGTFVYLHDNQLESMRIVHSRDQRGERERLVSLNGEAREVIRDDQTVTCIWPGSRSVNVSKARPRNPFPTELSEDLQGLEDRYRFRFLGEERVAGMAARVLAIEPGDQFRYGYRLWIDRQHFLMLRSDMLDQDGRPVEQVMFTDIRLLDRVPEELFRPVLDGTGYTWEREDRASVGIDADGSRWQVTRLPPGFRLTAVNRKASAAGGRWPVEQQVFSDGLASLSVFIEQLGDGVAALSGISRMGAVNAFGLARGDYNITVVGEVPVHTLQLVGESVAASGGAQ